MCVCARAMHAHSIHRSFLAPIISLVVVVCRAFPFETNFSPILSSKRNFPHKQMTRMELNRRDTTRRDSSKKHLGRNARATLYCVSRITVVSETSSLLRSVQFSLFKETKIILHLARHKCITVTFSCNECMCVSFLMYLCGSIIV